MTDVDHLKRAFQILDPEVSTGKDTASKDVENFSQSLYVECAEKAIHVSFSQFFNLLVWWVIF